MKKILPAVLLCCCLFVGNRSFATWSIIIIDPRTNEIGIAGASCTRSVYGIGYIVPGKGAVIVQAMSNPLPRWEAVKLLGKNTSPEAIMEAMRNPDHDPEEQQYAIVCAYATARPLTFTGAENHGYKGSLTSAGLSVQGNTLVSEDVIKAVFDAAIKAQKDSLSVQEILMSALEAGSRAGGDKRCGDRTASSAFLTVAKPSDDTRNPYINLVVVKKDESSNAVVLLRKKLDDRKLEDDLH